MDDNNILQNDKRKKNNRIENFFYKGANFSKEVVTNMEMHKEFIFIVQDKRFEIEIKYDMGRGRFQAWITYEGRKQSLSFFQTYDNAYSNVLDNIMYRLGAIEMPRIPGIGD